NINHIDDNVNTSNNTHPNPKYNDFNSLSDNDSNIVDLLINKDSLN
ncbi:19487_t:CDS:1, partial [Funneliformis geosporum]